MMLASEREGGEGHAEEVEEERGGVGEGGFDEGEGGSPDEDQWRGGGVGLGFGRHGSVDTTRHGRRGRRKNAKVASKFNGFGTRSGMTKGGKRVGSRRLGRPYRVCGASDGVGWEADCGAV